MYHYFETYAVTKIKSSKLNAIQTGELCDAGASALNHCVTMCVASGRKANIICEDYLYAWNNELYSTFVNLQCACSQLSGWSAVLITKQAHGIQYSYVNENYIQCHLNFI